MTRVAGRGMGGRVGVLAVLSAVLLAGCQSSSGSTSSSEDSSGTSSSASTTEATEPAKIKVSPADRAAGVSPVQTISVQAMTGTIDDVTVTGTGGRKVAGTVAGHEWTSAGRLAPDTKYTVEVRSSGPDGFSSTTKSTFRTFKPAVTATYSMVYEGETVGVAMPVSLQFDSEVTDARYRKAVEKAVSVKTVPATEGSWGWLDNRQLMWRPKDFWQPGTKVTLDAPLTGFQTGKDKWVDTDVKGTMTIGREQMTKVDIAKHTMTVSQGGATLKTFPVSSGRPGPETETRSGMKVVIGKQKAMTMDSATVGIKKGDPGYYNLDTDWNVRVTWTGEFLHSAPWSVGAQGSSNVSHGCVNLAPANAKWVYDNSLVGDPVDFTGSNREFQPTEGIGVWQYSWATWQKQSALT